MRTASTFHHLSSVLPSNKEEEEKIAGQAQHCEANWKIKRFSRE